MSGQIHPAAVIEAGARLGEDCEIGPFCYVGPHVTLGHRCRLHSHAVIDGHTTLGDQNEVFSFACLGKKTQDLKYQGATTSVRIGHRNVFREYVTVHAATGPAGALTTIGDECVLLAYTHVAHDCTLGSRIVMSSLAQIAGHVTIQDEVTLSGHSGVIQFARLGRGSFLGGMSALVKDVLPYCIADGIPAEPRIVNRVGMERRGKSPATIKAVEDAFKIVFRANLTLDEAVAQLRAKYADVPEVIELATFATAGSKLGLARPRARA